MVDDDASIARIARSFEHVIRSSPQSMGSHPDRDGLAWEEHGVKQRTDRTPLRCELHHPLLLCHVRVTCFCMGRPEVCRRAGRDRRRTCTRARSFRRLGTPRAGPVDTPSRTCGTGQPQGLCCDSTEPARCFSPASSSQRRPLDKRCVPCGALFRRRDCAGASRSNGQLSALVRSR